MENFYELFELSQSASIKQIYKSYRSKISKFNNLKSLSQEQIYEIKLLKSGLYILLNPELRNKYNRCLEKESQVKLTQVVGTNDNNEPTSLDELFNVDSSWMKETNINDKESRKEKNKGNVLGDRIFSMSNFNKRPGFSTDNEIELRKPLQGREDKSRELTN